MGKRQSLQQMVLGKLDSYVQKNKTGLPFNTLPQNKLKWIKHLNVKPEITKILEETTGRHYSNISCSNFFLDMSPKARETKAKRNYWDYVKIKKNAP